MKSTKFSSSFKKLRRDVSTLLYPFYSFCSDQLELNKGFRHVLAENFISISELKRLLDGHTKSIDGHTNSIEALFARNFIFHKQVRFLQNAIIVISSILVGVIFYLFLIS